MARMEQANTRDYTKWWQKPGTYPAMMQTKKPAIPAGRPISTSENFIRTVKGQQPYWMAEHGFDANTIWPDAMEECAVPEVPGYDWWGVKWANSEGLTGMMVEGGTRAIQDFSHWQDEFEFPDVSKVDFETDGKKIQTYLDPERVHIYECVKGIFERLNEVIPFEEALLAFYTDPEAVADFFKHMADYKIETCTKIFQYYGRVDGICYHDDWGTQRAPFFSNEMFAEQIMPETKRFFDFVHSTGRFIELHSCGKNVNLVPLMIEMGVDMWTPQVGINEPDYLYSHYGKDMSFCFAIPGLGEANMTEEEVRRAVRNFVDEYGETGRIMASVRVPRGMQERAAWAKDELYNYSLEYYKKLYNR